MHWNLVTNDELRGLNIPEQFLAFSEAYVEAAILLCEELVRNNAETTYVRGPVPLFLTHHATEPFLNAAILATDPESSLRNNHDIKKLLQRYKNLYPGSIFAFEAPFIADDPDLKDMEPELVREYFKWKEGFEKQYPENQRYRYPLNRQRQPFVGAYGFEANLFLARLHVLKEKMEAISRELPIARQETHFGEWAGN